MCLKTVRLRILHLLIVLWLILVVRRSKLVLIIVLLMGYRGSELGILILSFKQRISFLMELKLKMS